jgi:hypothetical protein
MKNKKILLYRDNYKLEVARGTEEQLKRKVIEITDIVFKAMGKRSLNYSLLISNGTTVLIDSYINEFAPNFPNHLDKKNRFLADTQTDLKKLETLISDYKILKAPLFFKPVINPDGEFTSQIKDTDFDMYLAEEEEDFYNTIIAYKDILNQMQSERYIHQNYDSTAIDLTRFLQPNPKDPKQAILRPESFNTI